MIAATRICRTTDGRLVSETHPDAAFLAYSVGKKIAPEDAALLESHHLGEQGPEIVEFRNSGGVVVAAVVVDLGEPIEEEEPVEPELPDTAPTGDEVVPAPAEAPRDGEAKAARPSANKARKPSANKTK